MSWEVIKEEPFPEIKPSQSKLLSVDDKSQKVFGVAEALKKIW